MQPPTVSPSTCVPGPGAGSPAGVPNTYDIPDVDPTRLLTDAVRDFPTSVAVRDESLVLDWMALDRVVREVANGLRDIGVGAGTVVAVPATWTVLDLVTPLAVWRCGGVVSLAGPGDGPPTKDADMVVSGVDTPTIPGWDGDVVRVALAPPTTRAWDRWRAARALSVTVSAEHRTSGRAPEQRPAMAASTAVVTTDEAGRQLVVDHGSLMAAAFSVRLWVPDMVAGEETMLLRGLTHANLALVLLPALLVAATTFVVRTDDPVRTAVAEGVTVLVTTGLAVKRQPPAATSPLRVLLHHGPVAPDVAEDLRRATGARVCQCGGVAAANWFTHAQPVYGRHAASPAGLPVTNVRTLRVDDDGAPVPPGVPGRLHIAGPQVIGGGWLDTGIRA